MRRNLLLKLSPNKVLLELLLLLLLLGWPVFAVCPSMCTCSRSHREVDCSWRGLRLLPEGLQYNIRTLNLSHNRFHSLDIILTPYTHLRILDLSYNRLTHLPAGLPRSLWQLYASYNRVQVLEKNDTAYQWNLKVLDLSYNKLDRAIFINNTLINLRTLNLSHNNFWTMPTNMPAQVDTIDLSHNLLAKILPGSLDRLPRLTQFYLQANRFTTMFFGALDKLTSLRIIHLGSNPWACHVPNEIAYIMSWTQQTSARVLGCPCHTQSICGGVRSGRWHFASYDLPPFAASTQGHKPSTPKKRENGRWDLPLTTPYPTLLTNDELTLQTMEDFSDTDSYFHIREMSPISETSDITDMAEATHSANTYFTTESPSTHTKKTTTLRTRSVRRQNAGGISSSASALAMCSNIVQSLGLLSIIIQQQGF